MTDLNALLQSLSEPELVRLERVLKAAAPRAGTSTIDLAAVINALRANPSVNPLTLPDDDDPDSDPRIYELFLEGHSAEDSRRIAAEERALKRLAAVSTPEPRFRRRRRFQEQSHVDE